MGVCMQLPNFLPLPYFLSPFSLFPSGYLFSPSYPLFLALSMKRSLQLFWLAAWLSTVHAQNHYVYEMYIKNPLSNGVRVSVKTDDPNYRMFQVCAYSYFGTKICVRAAVLDGMVDLDLVSGPDDEHYTRPGAFLNTSIAFPLCFLNSATARLRIVS
jgi:hypothetical protein